MRERVPESVEHIFRLQIPQRLELQPLGDVILKLLHFALYEREGALQRVIREASELENFRCLPGLHLKCT